MIKPSDIPSDTIVKHLHDQGHFHIVEQDGFRGGGPDLQDVLGEPLQSMEVERAIKSFQSMRGLKDDGYFGPKTLDFHLNDNRRCGMPDIMERGRGGVSSSEWPEACQLDISWFFDFSGLTFNDSRGRTWDDAWVKSINFWNDVAGCRLVKDLTGPSRINSRAGRMSGGTLAWSELAYGDCNARLDQEYNRSVDWRWFIGWTTICHEVGHALGWGHAPNKGNVMYYAHDEGYDGTPGPWDIKQATDRYGKPAPKPDPPPEPDPPPGGPSEIGGEGAIYLEGVKHQFSIHPPLDYGV
jgi:hypothetical protein